MMINEYRMLPQSSEVEFEATEEEWEEFEISEENTKPSLFEGVSQYLSQVGPQQFVPQTMSFFIEADTIEEAFQKYHESVLKRFAEMQEEQRASSNQILAADEFDLAEMGVTNPLIQR